jgi:hypothetical protein
MFQCRNNWLCSSRQNFTNKQNNQQQLRLHLRAHNGYNTIQQIFQPQRRHNQKQTFHNAPFGRLVTLNKTALA